MRIAEQKQEQMMAYIRKLETRLNGEKEEGLPKLQKKTDRSSGVTIPIPIVQHVKGDVNSHSMLEIESSSASVTTIEDNNEIGRAHV